MLLCRSVDNMDLLLARCRDTLLDGRGLIIPLIDSDLIAGLRERVAGLEFPLETRLEEIHRQLAVTGA